MPAELGSSDAVHLAEATRAIEMLEQYVASTYPPCSSIGVDNFAKASGISGIANMHLRSLSTSSDSNPRSINQHSDLVRRADAAFQKLLAWQAQIVKCLSEAGTTTAITRSTGSGPRKEFIVLGIGMLAALGAGIYFGYRS